MRIYAIGGLGADERVFQFLRLNHELVPLSWIKPKKNEQLNEYARRMSEQISPDEPFILMGVSFGGLVAIEINKIVSSSLVILISSIEKSKEIPRIYRLIGKSGLIRLIPKFLMNPPKWLINVLFGAKNKKLLAEIINDTDPSFLKWALEQLCVWTNDRQIPNLMNITGSRDKLLPLKESNRRVIIEKGGHFMVVDKATEVSLAINNTIAKFDLK